MDNSTSNPRYKNGHRRRSNRKRLKAEGRPCWICQEFGRYAVINYSLPPGHPGAFEVDELCPVSRWKEGGYSSPEACANDYQNLAAAHRACNQWRGNKTVEQVRAIAQGQPTQDPKRKGDPLPQPWDF